MTAKVSLDFEMLKPKIANSVKETLASENRTPEGEKAIPCDVFVPTQQLEADEDEPGAAYATVVYATYVPNERRHVVRVKFKYDKAGKFQRNTMTYV
jgi:hypothetical protein